MLLSDSGGNAGRASKTSRDKEKRKKKDGIESQGTPNNKGTADGRMDVVAPEDLIFAVDVAP